MTDQLRQEQERQGWVCTCHPQGSPCSAVKRSALDAAERQYQERVADLDAEVVRRLAAEQRVAELEETLAAQIQRDRFDSGDSE